LEEFLASSVDDEIITYFDISSTATNNFATISSLLEEQPTIDQVNQNLCQQDIQLNDEEVFDWNLQDLNFTANHGANIENVSFANSCENPTQFTIRILPEERLSTKPVDKKTRRSNAERCKDYRSLQKIRKLNLEDELEHQSKRNILLKQKADSLEKTVKRMRALILKKCLH